MSVTARQIAQELGVSEATVSLVLNGRRGVSSATRERVVSMARHMGYDFKRARGARSQGSIAFVIFDRQSFFSTQFFQEVQSGVLSVFDESDYSLSMARIDGRGDVQAQVSSRLPTDCIGIIVFATEMEAEEFEPIVDISLPVVWLDNPLAPTGCDSVVINNYLGMQQALGYLTQTYPGMPGHLCGGGMLANFDERRRGLHRALRAMGGSTKDMPELLLPVDVEAAQEALLAELDRGLEPQRSYVADNDFIALGAIRALRQRGHRVPEDVAVMGFDDIGFARLSDPPLSTISVPKAYLGQVAAERLLCVLDAGYLQVPRELHPIRIEVNTSPVIRESA